MALKCEHVFVYFFEVRVVCDNFVFYAIGFIAYKNTLAIFLLRFMRDIFFFDYYAL